MSQQKQNTLLAKHEAAPYEILNPRGSAPLLLVCDHASNAIPEALAELGLPRALRQRHIAWDSGAAEVTRALARRLDAPAVLGTYSRLVIDLNRAPGTPQSILECSDGVRVPGNAALTAEQKRQREDEIFAPYHAALAGLLKKLDAREPQTLFVPIHSFTPSLAGADAPRPWHFGVLWRGDPRVAVPLLRALRAQPDLCVGDNLPYSGHSEQNHSVDFHAYQDAQPIRPSAAVEIREDLIRDADGQAWAANLLAGALGKILANPATRGSKLPKADRMTARAEGNT